MQKLGEYELAEVIGTGGMSTVYHAYQPKLRRHVAIKVLSPDLAEQVTYVQRFHQEAATVARLQHRHIMPIYDYGMVEHVSYFVMPLLSGGTLIERILRKPVFGSQLIELPDIAHFLMQIAGALAFAHAKGVIHRDIKPSNIIFDESGNPFLSDFGIACMVSSTARNLDASDVMMGTYAYISPELWYGASPTPQVDQYALGLVIYALVTGHAAFGANASAIGELVRKHTYEMPVPIHYVRGEASAALSQVIEKAIAKNPAARYENVIAFAEAFEKVVKADSESLSPKVVDRPQPAENWASMVTRIAGAPGRTSRTTLSDSGPRSEKIFVSYRRSDSTDIAERICDRLVAHFGAELVFRDMDSIPLGTNFKKYLENVVHQCLVELVIIGRGWLETIDEVGRQLDNPSDFVRVEIEAALNMDIPMIPLLVQDAVMPRKDQLPEPMAELVYCYGIPVRTDPAFDTDMQRLIKALEQLIYPPKR